MNRSWLIGMYFLSVVALHGQATLTIDRDSLRIGDQFTATLAVDVPPGGKWLNRDAVWPDSMEAFAIVSTPDMTASGPTIRDAYTLAVFDTGVVTLPALSIVISGPAGQDTLRTEPLMLNVASVEPDSGGLQPIRDIRREPFRPAYYLRYLPYLIGVLVVVAILVYAYRRRPKPVREASQPLPPVVPPDVWAMQQLDALTADRLWQRGDVKGHYSRLTDIFRDYLERRYRIHAREQTTGEITRQLSGLQIDTHVVEDVAQLLEIADYVKFAKADPGVDLHQAAIDRVRQFVRGGAHGENAITGTDHA
jgi:hypothetical protein